ncbi:MAG: YggU family protein [Candidatus Diapherotrites archaeon CG11_big_fil_rev_8_21_14_0_20_37_9]|nr:MAG: YggU family protein [Candidatus Diapherotrites archaeon CG11_big_fil_rev_8_21_14_0_20_37_9]
MESIKVRSQPSTTLDLEITPNSKEFGILGFNSWTNALKVRVKEKATKGKANQELITELGKLLDAKVMIIKGEKSNHKKILVESPESIVNKHLKKAIKH